LTPTQVQILLHARKLSHSFNFAEAGAEFSAMKEALKRNHNANLHKLPAECVLKLFETTLLS
jgi:hypothetical protein